MLQYLLKSFYRWCVCERERERESEREKEYECTCFNICSSTSIAGVCVCVCVCVYMLQYLLKYFYRRSQVPRILSNSQKVNALVHLLCKITLEFSCENVCLVPGAPAGYSIRLPIYIYIYIYCMYIYIL